MFGVVDLFEWEDWYASQWSKCLMPALEFPLHSTAACPLWVPQATTGPRAALQKLWETLPSAAWSMVTNFYPSRHCPLSWPVYSFSYLFIFWGRAQIISSYHYFTFLDIANWRILRGPLKELTRIAVLSLHQWNRFLLFPLCTLFPGIMPGEAESVLLKSLCPCTGGNAWLWTIIAQVSLFLWAKIFPEWRRETRMIDGLEPSLISRLADSLVMYAPGWCAERWQLIDSPGLGYREDETCLEHLTCCLCGAPEHRRLSLLWMQAWYARLGRWLSVPELKAEVFFSFDDCQRTEFFAFLIGK